MRFESWVLLASSLTVAAVACGSSTGSSSSASTSSGASSSGDAPGPTVQIQSPKPNQVFTLQEPIQLTGTVEDPVDGMISDQKIVHWYIQHGAIIDPAGEGLNETYGPVDAGGSYTISLKATDSRNKMGEASVDITVK